MYTLLYLKSITNKVLPYSTGLRGSLDGRRLWGEWITCICMAELFCCAPVAIRTLLISYTPIWGKKSQPQKAMCYVILFI